MRRTGILAGTLLTALFLSSNAWCQANVNESLETAFVYVDTNNGSDLNPGTQALPLKTIGKAVQLAVANNQNSIGTRVTINPGTYRESLFMGATTTDTNLPITFQAATNGTVIVSGSVLYTGWQPSSGNSSIFKNAWPNKWGLCPANPTGPLEQNIVLRREMIFVNGTQLTQVLSLAQMLPGTFFVDEAGATVYVWPPTGTNMTTAAVEVATLPDLFSIVGRNDIVLRGLTFQYSNGCRTDSAASVYGSSGNILFDSDSFSWNNSNGLAILNPTNSFTVRNSVANHNGIVGFRSFQAKNGLWQSDEASYNNWRGAQGAYYTWNRAGDMFFSEHSSTYTDLKTLFNQAHGIHWDTDNTNLTVSSVLSSQNLLDAIFVEESEGPVSISLSTLCNSNVAQSPAVGGLELRNSEFVALTESTLFNNGVSEIDIQGQPGGITGTNWETGQSYNLVTQNFTATQNIIDGNGSAQQVFLDSYLGGSDWAAFETTLLSDHNNWWNASNSSVFTVPSPNIGTLLNFAGWQSATAQDPNSTFSAPAVDPSTACAVTPDFPDYWLVADNPAQTVSAATTVFNVSVIPLGLTGTFNLSLDGISEVPGLSSSLSRATIDTSGSSALSISASPTTTPGTYPVTVFAKSGNLTRSVTVSLIVPATSVSLSANNLTFGPQQVNTTSPAQKVTLTNTGSVALGIASLTVTGTNTGDFVQTNTCGTFVAVGSSCTISVIFTPTAAGARAASVSITDNATGSPQLITLTGTGVVPVVSLSPTSLLFGNQAVGTTSTARKVTLQNTGPGTLTINGIAVTGTNSLDFAQTNTCTSPMAVGAACTINVTFRPAAPGARNASVSITDNGSGSPQVVALTGTGLGPVATFSATSESFGNQVVGTTSAAKTVTLTNTGNAALNLTSTTIKGTNPGDFAQTNTCGTSVAAGKNCTISITFTPATLGTRNATVSIADNASGSPQIVSLTGIGQTAVTLSTSALTFPAQKVRTTSLPQKVTLTNSGKTLAIHSIIITGANSTDFTQTNTCGGSVTKICTITVTFTPRATGTRTAAITISDSDPTSPQTVSLRGTGQ